MKWSIHSVSVCHCQRGPPESPGPARHGEGGASTQGGQDISGSPAPDGGGIMSKKKKKKRGKKSGTKKEDKWADAASANDSWDGAAGRPDASRFPQFPLPLRPRCFLESHNSKVLLI